MIYSQEMYAIDIVYGWALTESESIALLSKLDIEIHTNWYSRYPLYQIMGLAQDDSLFGLDVTMSDNDSLHYYGIKTTVKPGSPIVWSELSQSIEEAKLDLTDGFCTINFRFIEAIGSGPEFYVIPRCY